MISTKMTANKVDFVFHGEVAGHDGCGGLGVTIAAFPLHVVRVSRMGGQSGVSLRSHGGLIGPVVADCTGQFAVLSLQFKGVT